MHKLRKTQIHYRGVPGIGMLDITNALTFVYTHWYVSQLKLECFYLGAHNRYKHCLNLSIECTSVYFYEPRPEGAFVTTLIPNASEYDWKTYVSQRKIECF